MLEIVKFLIKINKNIKDGPITTAMGTLFILFYGYLMFIDVKQNQNSSILESIGQHSLLLIGLVLFFSKDLKKVR